MKKHILFSSGSLRMGGLERILVEYLNKIDKDKYKITLFILSDFGELDVFRKDIPKHIDIRFLKPENNPMFGKIWITDGVNNKVIDKNSLIKQGWKRGRNIRKKKQQK